MSALSVICGMILLPGTLHVRAGAADSAAQAVLFHAGMSYYLPGGDMAGRFGGNAGAGGALTYKPVNNLHLVLSGNFLFGSNVKEDSVLSVITTSGGYVIGADGNPADVSLEERGFWLMGGAGKVINFRGMNPGSGILLSAGGGFVRHKILIRTGASEVPQLNENYRKGYDRLSDGGALYESITFLHLDSKKYLNFQAGLEFVQAFTKNRRDINFDTGEGDASLRTDLFFGIKVMWILPFYLGQKDKPHTY